jgi:hypothetical protein
VVIATCHVTRLTMPSTSLTLRRQKFGSEYVETGNATQAARLAGYSPRTSAQHR